MRKTLFLCNTVYQVLVAIWIRYKYIPNDEADIIISNHMNGYKIIAQNMIKTCLFNNVYTVDSLSFSKGDFSYKNKIKKYFNYFLPKYELKEFLDLKNKYDNLYFSNCDRFSALLYDVLKRKNRKLKLFMFEDGTSSYSQLIKKFYEDTAFPRNKLKCIAFKFIFRRHFIFGNVTAMYAFNPQFMEWKPDFSLLPLKHIDYNDEKLKNIINIVFDYYSLEDAYSEKYIFFEESFYAETGYNEDLNLVEKLAEIVGKENIFIKIHPRNPVNRFQNLGFKTNKNTFIPWEVIAMNTDISDKKLITIISSSILNPVSVFNMNSKGYSLINCLNNPPKIIEGEFGQLIIRLFKQYNDNIYICNDIMDIFKEIK